MVDQAVEQILLADEVRSLENIHKKLYQNTRNIDNFSSIWRIVEELMKYYFTEHLDNVLDNAALSEKVMPWNEEALKWVQQEVIKDFSYDKFLKA